MKSKSSTVPLSNRLGRALTVVTLLFLLQTAPVFSAIYFVATNGVDSNSGSSNSPFATIMKAQSAAASGDTVYLRGGTFFLDNSNFTATNNPWAIVNNITKSGISYLAYPGEDPIFDFTNVKPETAATNRVTAFLVMANNCVFQGFEVVGVQVTIKTVHTQSECFRIAGGSNNRFEQLSLHDGMANGWYLTAGASNLVLNCDAYNNKGLDGGSIGNTDGFGCHPSKGGKGNIIRGCRAWFNSDDGYDCINAFERVTFDHCWAFYNGYWTNFSNPGGDGNGFKGGGYGANGTNSPGKPLPVPVPRHLIQFSVAVKNRVNGFYSNHHAGGSDWYDNTAYRNSTDYNMLNVLSDNSNNVPGYDHVMKNNLGYNGNTEVSNLDTNNSDVSFNFFTLSVTVATNDFLTLDESLLTQPRQANGDLPYIAFARLTNTSDCINAGTNLGFAFYGAAPDLGAFEFGPTNAPSPTVALFGTNLVFTGSGWANQTNYLIASTNLTFPVAQWTRIATNVSDLSGLCAFTNAIPAGVPQRFYRTGVQ